MKITEAVNRIERLGYTRNEAIELVAVIFDTEPHKVAQEIKWVM